VTLRYLFAKCCYDLKKLQEAELALTGALYPGASTNIADLFNMAGAPYELLGDVCRKAG
jgi:hypothetical protein